MRNALVLWLGGCGLLGVSSVGAAPPSPGGWSIDESECASGGPTTRFNLDGTVVRTDCGERCPYILEGRWTQAGEVLTLKFEQAFYGLGGKPAAGPMGNRPVFDDYTGKVEPVAVTDTVQWTGPDAGEGCEKVVANRAWPEAGARGALVGDFEPEWPEVSRRALDADDLKGKSKETLARMRNQVYARYGYIFKRPALRAYFSSRPGYRQRFTDVSPFLTPLELSNVAFIKAAEKRLK